VSLLCSGQAGVLPFDAVMSSCTGTNCVQLSQSKNVLLYDQQPLMSSGFAGAGVKSPANVHCMQSNHLTHGNINETVPVDVGYMSPTFALNTGSHRLDFAQNVDHIFPVISSKTESSYVQQDYISTYSALSDATTCGYEAFSGHRVERQPAYEWSSTAISMVDDVTSHHNHLASWQNVQQLSDAEFSAAARTVYSVAAPMTSAFVPPQTSMQYLAVSSVGGTSPAPSPIQSPYLPSVSKMYSEELGSKTSQQPVAMQQHYLANLLQLHYLLLASNKMMAPRYLQSLAAPRFDAYIPGNLASVTRPSMFDISRLPLPPGSFQPMLQRFPR